MPGELRWTEEQFREHMERMKHEPADSFLADSMAVLAKPPAKPKKAIRSRQPNKTETRYAGHLLQQSIIGTVRAYQFEAITLKLANGCRYTPDFMVTAANPFEAQLPTRQLPTIYLDEVKGTRNGKPYMTDDGRAKLLTAARLFPMFRFRLCWHVSGEWRTELIAQ